MKKDKTELAIIVISTISVVLLAMCNINLNNQNISLRNKIEQQEEKIAIQTADINEKKLKIDEYEYLISDLEKNQWTSLGIYELTAYCPCVKCSGNWDKITATGTKATEGKTIGVDPNLIPYGSKIKINDKIYIAEDTGTALKDKKVIDIFMESHEDALNFGRQKAEIYILSEG